MVVFDPLLFNTFVLLSSLLIVFKGADYIVYGITGYAKKIGISDILSGLVVVAMAASMPEIIAGIMGLVLGSDAILFGAILGTNMVHMALVIGVLSIVGKKINLESEILGKGVWVLWLVLLVPFALMLWDQNLGRIDGVILVALYFGFLVWLWKQEEKKGKLKHRILMSAIWKPGLIFLFALIAILLAGRWLVFSAVNIAALLGLSAYFISATVIAFCGALPDFAVGFRSIMRGHQAVGVGDILGSVSLQFLLFFGIVGIIKPIQINVGEIINAVVFLIISLTLLIYFVNKKSITWRQGLIFLGIYLAFISIEISKLIN